MEVHTFSLEDGRTLNIREANQDDAELLVKFLPEAFEETDCLLMTRHEFDQSIEQEADFLGKMSASKTQLALVALVDSTLVGILTFTGRDLERVRHTGEVGLIISKAYWSMGIGKRLMQCLHIWADSNNLISKIDLRVRLSNRRAIKLYERLGYQIEGWIRRAVKIGDTYDDHYWMGKESPFNDRP